MEQSILISVKKILGIDAGDSAFDLDILTHINSAFSTLHQLGIGPEDGFQVEDDEALWVDFIGADPRLNQVRTYVCLKTRILFDPPTTSYLIGAINKQIEELEWRINDNREQTAWRDPNPPIADSHYDVFGDPIVIEGGGA
jgi:hypothetical protein